MSPPNPLRSTRADASFAPRVTSQQRQAPVFGCNVNRERTRTSSGAWTERFGVSCVSRCPRRMWPAVLGSTRARRAKLEARSRNDAPAVRNRFPSRRCERTRRSSGTARADAFPLLARARLDRSLAACREVCDPSLHVSHQGFDTGRRKNGRPSQAEGRKTPA
jgi:hypothetical protein